jgi:hypothetical protein
MPGAVKGVIAIVIIQAVFNGLGALVLFAYAADRNDHGQDGAGFANFMGVFSLVVTVLLIVAAIGLGQAKPWSRGLTIGLEILSIIGAVLTIFTGNPAAIVGLGLSIAALVMVNNDESQAWLNA